MIPIWLQEWGSGRNVVLTLILWGLFAGLLFGLTSYRTLQAANEHRPLLEERLGYGPDDVRQQMRRLDEWRESYRNVQILDYIHAFLLAVALLSALAYVLPRLAGQASPLTALVWLPVAALAGEFVENTCLILLTAVYPSVPVGLVRIASLGTIVKLVGDGLAIAVVVGGALWVGVRSLVRKAS